MLFPRLELFCRDYPEGQAPDVIRGHIRDVNSLLKLPLSLKARNLATKLRRQLKRALVTALRVERATPWAA